jgi:hypothetical protein
VAVAETEQAWIEAASGKTIRELEALVASRGTGDAPDTPAPERPRERVLRFEVAADTFATFREAMQQTRRLAGTRLDDDAILLSMARQVLGGPRDEGRSSHQISLGVCGSFGAGAQSAAGELLPVDGAVVTMAACDAQYLGELLPRATGPRAAKENASLDEVPNAVAEDRSSDDAEPSRHESAAPHQSSSHAHVGARGPQGNEVATDPTPSEPAARAKASPGQRAKQAIAPALRRAVLARDQHRCRVPGCTHATFVDVHHVQPRSEGGRNEASNLLGSMLRASSSRSSRRAARQT